MAKTYRVTVEFQNDGHIDFCVTSRPHNILIMGIPPTVDPELWLISIMLRALQPQAPAIKPEQHKRAKQPNGTKPAYADGHAVERIRHNKKAMKGDL